MESDDADEIVAFTRDMIAANDLAPAYPLLRKLGEMRSYDEQQRYWLSLLFVAYHHLPSALTAVRLIGDRLPERAIIERSRFMLNNLPNGVERRLFHGRTAEYLIELLAECDPAAPLAMSTFMTHSTLLSRHDKPYENYRRFTKRWRRLPGHRNRWAAFEMARVLRYVHDWPIRAPSLMLSLNHEHHPSPALRRLYKYDGHSITVLKRLAEMFRTQLQRSLIELDWEMVELVIRKADRFHTGRYYVGYGLDEILSQMNRLSELSDEDRVDLLAARAACFEPRYLGEANDWDGVRADRLRSSYWPRILRPLWYQ